MRVMRGRRFSCTWERIPFPPQNVRRGNDDRRTFSGEYIDDSRARSPASPFLQNRFAKGVEGGVHGVAYSCIPRRYLECGSYTSTTVLEIGGEPSGRYPYGVASVAHG